MASATQEGRKLTRRVSEIREQWSELRRDRSLVVAWLVSARKAQITAGLLLLLGIFVMPPLRDELLSEFYPRVSSGGFLGIGARRVENPKVRTPRRAITGAYWLGSLGAVGLLLWLHVPVVLARRRRGGTELAPTLLVDSGTPTLAVGAGAAHVSVELGVPDPGSRDSAGAARRPGGRYVIETELGRGAMGIVYRARDDQLGRMVALKQLPGEFQKDVQLAERFRREARVLAQLNHAGIVQVFDLIEDDAGMWIAMELVSGGSLAARIDARGALPFDETVRLGAQIADALGYAHSKGVVHRDFKPDNVLISETGRAKVADFGLARLGRDPRLTQSGAILGTPAYMSPEQAVGGESDARSDTYALGVALYEMLTGVTPFEGETAAILAQHITQAPPLDRLDAFPRPLVELLAAMLAKQPGDRPAEMSQVRRVLEQLIDPG